MKPIPSLDVVLRDEDAERVRRNHDQRIKQQASRPAFALEPLGEVELEDGVVTAIAHKLGRAPAQVITSPVRGASTTGRIEEVREGDRTKTIKLKASGWGATIAVDVAVL